MVIIENRILLASYAFVFKFCTENVLYCIYQVWTIPAGLPTSLTKKKKEKKKKLRTKTHGVHEGLL